MSIIHIKKREHPYVQIDKRCLSDNRLSWRARGVLAYLLSKPNDWIVSVKDLESQGLEGRDAVQNAMKELQKIGYARLEIAQDDIGRLLGKRWIVNEEPTNGFSGNGLAADELKNRLTEKPFNGKSAPTNNEYSSNNEKERDASEKNSPSPAENSTLEAENLEGDNLPGGILAEIHDGEIGATVCDLIPPAPVTDPPAHRIELGDRPTAETPGQLQKNLEAFYAEPDWQNEWADGVCRISGVWIPDSPQKEARLKSILSDFCDHAIKNNQQRDTYRQLNAAFQQWVKRERYATWKQPKQAAQNVQQQPTTGIPYQIRKL